MAKTRFTVDNNKLSQMAMYDLNISRQDMIEYGLEIMTRYGINVLLQRMAPSILDGLIPAKRRALFTLFKDMNSKPDGSFNKVADIAGRTIGKYHPHGLASVESTITNMGKLWAMNHVLVEPTGNFGTVLGAPPAAGRYIEGCLSEYAYKCLFEEYDEDILDMIPNYTRREMEPLYLPSKYPNFLICGNSGIGVGFTSDIPKFNLREAFELTIALIEHPEMTGVHLFPDSPRGYDIIDRGDTREICDNGDGSFLMRGRINYVEDKGGNYIQIVSVTEQTTLDKIDKKIVDLIKEGKIQGVKDIVDDSNLNFVDYKMLLKPEANHHEIIDTIYRTTAMQDSLTMKFNFAERTNFISLGLKDSILEWVEQRKDIKQRRYSKTLRNLKEREHHLEILIRILEGANARKTSDIFTTSDNAKIAAERLMETFGITTLQATTISNMKNSQLTRDSKLRYIKEFENIKDDIADIEQKVRSKDFLSNDIIKDLEEGIELFGKDRQCLVVSNESIKREVTKHTIVVTKKFVKKLSSNVSTPGTITNGDELVSILRNVPNDGKITILDVKGRIYNIPVEKLMSNELAAKGTDLLQTFGVNEDIIFVFWTHQKDDNTNKFLTTFTKTGLIKKTSLDEYSKLRTQVAQGALVNIDDHICYASITTPDDKKTLVYMNNGYGIIIDLDNISTTGRVSKGFNHIKLTNGVYIQGICNAKGDDVVVLTKKGYCKLCNLSDIDQARKKDDLTRFTSLNDGDEVIFMKPVVKGNVMKVSFEEGSFDINVQEIPIETRLSKGKKVVPIKRGTSIVKVKIV